MQEFIIEALSPLYFWLIVAAIFVFLELSSPGLFFFLAFGAGSLGGCLAAYFEYSFMTQCVVALVSSLVVLLILKTRLAQPLAGEAHAKTNVDALIGKSGKVIKKIHPPHTGQVLVGGEIWSARSKDDVALEEGALIRVVKMQGNHVLVEKKDLK
jgi:membrane protein implicated in regulation of membrane protease activity